MKPVSFGSNFRAYVLPNSDKNQRKGMLELINYCQENEIPHELNYSYQKKTGLIQGLDITTVATINAPEEKDVDIETICANRGIKFIKKSAEDIKDIEGIKKRLKTPYTKQIIYVDAKRLEEIAKEQHSNLAECREKYENGSKEIAMDRIESGNPLYLPTLNIAPCASSEDEAIEDLQDYGSDFIPPVSYYIDLDRYSKDGNENLFFAMQELGMKNVPVYIEPENYELIKAMDLIKEG